MLNRLRFLRYRRLSLTVDYTIAVPFAGIDSSIEGLNTRTVFFRKPRVSKGFRLEKPIGRRQQAPYTKRCRL